MWSTWDAFCVSLKHFSSWFKILSSQSVFTSVKSSWDYLLFLYLTLQDWDLDLHLLDLVLRQDLNTGTGVGVVQGLESQVCQRDVPLALVLLVATGRWPKKGKDYKEEENKRTQNRSEIRKNTLPTLFSESPEDKAINIYRKGTDITSLKNQNHHNRWGWCGWQILCCVCVWYIASISIFYLFGEQPFFKLLLFKLNRLQRIYLIWTDIGKIGHFCSLFLNENDDGLPRRSSHHISEDGWALWLIRLLLTFPGLLLAHYRRDTFIR